MFLFSRQPASCTEFHKKETPVCVPHLTDQCLLVFFLQFKRSGNPQSLLRCGYILPSPSASDHPSRSPAAVLTYELHGMQPQYFRPPVPGKAPDSSDPEEIFKWSAESEIHCEAAERFPRNLLPSACSNLLMSSSLPLPCMQIHYILMQTSSLSIHK